MVSPFALFEIGGLHLQFAFCNLQGVGIHVFLLHARWQ